MTLDVNTQQEKERLAREWLAKLKPLLTLDKDEEKSKAKYGGRRGKPSSKATYGAGKYADVSDDDEMDENEGASKRGDGDKENAMDRHKDVFVKV